MGDRCAVYFNVKESDHQAFLAALNRATDYGHDVDPDEVCEDSIHFYEVNCGWYTEIEQMVKDQECPPFICHQEEGSGYGAMVHVFVGGEYENCVCDHDGCPVARIAPEGIADDDVAVAENYWRLLRIFNDYLQEI